MLKSVVNFIVVITLTCIYDVLLSRKCTLQLPVAMQRGAPIVVT